MANCISCGKPNGFLKVGSPEQDKVPMCLDCYAKLQGVQLKQAHFYQHMAWEAEQQLNDQFESFGVPVNRRPPPPPINQGSTWTVNNIEVKDSQVGSLNTGTIESFSQSVSMLRESGNIELASATNELVTSVLQVTELSVELKNEVIEQLSGLVEQASTPPKKRRLATARTIAKRISEILGDTASVGKLWERVQTLLGLIF